MIAWFGRNWFGHQCTTNNALECLFDEIYECLLTVLALRMRKAKPVCGLIASFIDQLSYLERGGNGCPPATTMEKAPCLAVPWIPATTMR
uniref:Uncharacterized protein n=1 Tax=Romanomermis culicivorax TaxID=13658 RepID=A0A915JPD9_ROMCU